jgi:aminoglycoside N3'-acetyltransferase
MIDSIWGLLRPIVSPDSLMANLEELWRYDRWFSYDKFETSCAAAVEQMMAAGLEDAEVISFPADGKTVYGDMPMPLAWDAEEAELHLIEEDGSQRLLASYQDTPCNLLMFSSPTLPEGIEADVVRIEDGANPVAYEGLELAGKIIFTSAPPSGTIPLAAAHGAAGIISDWLRTVPGVSDRESLKDAVGWINDGFNALGTRGRDDLDIFGFMLSPKAGDALRQRFDRGESIRVKARVKARLYKGTLGVATGLIPGVDREKEILLTGHLFEPGAGDNASGVAAMIEACRALTQLIKEGKQPQPKRSIRCVFGLEILGLSAYLHKKRFRLKNIIAGLNLDDIGGTPEIRSRLSVHGLHDASPSFVGYLADHLALKLGDLFPGQSITTGVDFDQYDNHGCDPMMGAPTPVIAASKKMYYHTSLDTPYTLDPKSLAAHAALAATYCYTIASAGLDDALELAHLGMTPALERICKRADARIDRARKDGASYGGAAHLAEAVTFYGDVEIQGLRALRCFVPEEEWADFDAEIAHHVAQLVELVTRKCAEVEEIQASPCEAPAEADRLVPKRTTFGLLTFENLPDDARQQMKADRDLRMGVWGSAQDTLFWCDGKRTVRDVAMMIGHSTGRYNVAATLKRLKFLEEQGHMKLLQRIGRAALANQIGAMGIEKGDTLWVHSSLSNLGFVDGGPAAVVEALLDVLGPDGTLVMPCFYNSFVCRDQGKPAFSRAISPASVGIIADTFRTWPGTVRSESPTHSVAALGPLQDRITTGHKGVTPYAHDGPFGILYEMDVKVLFLGCGLGPNSFLHAFEDWKDMAYLTTEEVRATDDQGNPEIVAVDRVPMGHRDFYSGNDSKIARAMLDADIFQAGKIAMADVLLTTAQTMGNVVLPLLDSDPHILLCDEPDCKFCTQYD